MAYLNFIIKFTNVLGDFVQFREIVFGLEKFGLERSDCILLNFNHWKVLENNEILSQ